MAVCLIVRVPTIIRMCSMETYGSKHANEKPRKTSHAEPYFVISPTTSATGYRVSFPSGSVATASEPPGARNAALTCPWLQGAISSTSALAWKTCFTTFSPLSTIPLTALPMLERCAWAGRAFRFRAGPTETLPRRLKPLPRSAARGRELAALLNPETPVPGVTTGTLRPESAIIAVPATVDGRNMVGDDFALTAGWGHFGTGDAVMPGQGRIVERAYTQDERAALGDAASMLGQTTFDIYLNGNAFWRNVPSYRLALQTGRLSGAQEMAVLPRRARAGTGATTGGSAITLQRWHGASRR